MKEREIVDFETFQRDADDEDEILDEHGNPIGCLICETHERAYKFFDKDEMLDNMVKITKPRCPKCGKFLSQEWCNTTMANNAVVSEGNYSNPEGQIGLYSIWECEDCADKLNITNGPNYALMPVPVSHNGNHDIWYTGGESYIIDDELDEFIKLIYDKIMPSIENYVKRKLNPEGVYDTQILGINNLRLWCKGDIEHALAEYLYKRGLKY